ncbi:hypothetical protein XELAEV_18003731mg [Xenopus laevis]|uniref:Uncharacterized protein n=1 Tax=Xenopus laevis TaxID=8355 RepID=A0A974GYX6_XENLA|nr:hypothetical protein XELAEV_18003731mg [Xenopus laevis]
MMILPQLSYLFINLPIKVLQTFFIKLQRMLNKFILMNKHSRFSNKVLSLPVSNLGLGVSDIEKYYQATILEQSRSVWTNDTTKQWINIEEEQLPFGTYKSFLESRLVWKVQQNTKNPISANMLRIWKEMIKLYKKDILAIEISTSLTTLNSVIKNIELDLEHLITCGIINVEDLLVGSEIKQFDELVSAYDIPTTDKLTYLKIHRFLTKHPLTPLVFPPKIKKLLQPEKTNLKRIPTFYKSLLEFKDETPRWQLRTMDLPPQERLIMNHIFITTRNLIASNWKSLIIPKIDEILKSRIKLISRKIMGYQMWHFTIIPEKGEPMAYYLY